VVEPPPKEQKRSQGCRLELDPPQEPFKELINFYRPFQINYIFRANIFLVDSGDFSFSESLSSYYVEAMMAYDLWVMYELEV
jgi:hypothetical protein